MIKWVCTWLRCCVHWFVNCGLYNHTTIKPFKGNELMLSPFKGDELMLRPLKGDELKIFENNWGVVCFIHFIDRVCVLKCFLGWTWIRRERPWQTFQSLGLGGKYTWFECSFKPVSIPHGWSIPTKQRDHDWCPYDFT